MNPGLERAVSGIKRDAAEALTLAPALAKPQVAWIWATHARRGQIALVTAAVLMLLVLPALYGALLRVVYPPKTVAGGILGLQRQTRDDPRAQNAARALLVLSGVAAAGVVGLFWWSDLPKAARHAIGRARLREAEADSLLSVEPSRSLLLYRAALAVTADPVHETALREKLREIDRKMATSLAPPTVGTAAVTTPPRVQSSVPPIPIGGATMMPEGKTSARVGPRGRFLLQAELGKGGMGVVHLAQDTVLDREVALKELPARLASDPSFAERFRHEARVVARLTHPNIVQIFDLVEDGDRIWIAMELMGGGDLEGLLERTPKLAVHDAARIVRPLAEALAFAHSKGVVHRDVKPMNVLFAADRTPKLTDFGLASLAERTMHTQEGAVLGSPRYMSPEQAAGRKADARADVYALGVTLYQMVTGVLPFEGDVASLLAQHITRAPRAPRDIAAEVPAEIDDLVLLMLEKDPARRMDMIDVARLLAPFTTGA